MKNQSYNSNMPFTKLGQSTMSPEELKKIVKKFGGVEALSKQIKFTPRAIRHWLSGERKIHPATADHIRSKLTKGEK